MTDKPLSARIEVFRPGTFRPMRGEPLTYSADDLQALADAYDAATAPAPVVVGHPNTDAPAYGWVEKFEYDAGQERLFATLQDVEPQFAEMVKAGRFKKVSMAFFAPEQGHNPVPGIWYPKHLGFLGAAAPGVPGLKNAHFAAPADAVFTADFAMGGDVASMFRSMRDFFIDKFGLEAADKALPSWQIDWIEQSDAPPQSLFTAPIPPQNQEDPDVSKTDTAFAAREADLAERERLIAEREAAAAHATHVAFAEALVQEGRLLPVLKPKVVAILDALPVAPSVAFAEGEAKVPASEALREVLKAQPRIVSFGEADLGDDPGAGATGAAFAADGRAVDPVGLALHIKAEAYQRQNPGTSYLDAVTAVSS